MNTKANISFPVGFTAVDNRIFYMQNTLSPNAFSILIRIYRMSNGYDSKPKSLSNTYFQKTCNISKNTVTKAVKELENLSLIVTQRRSRSNTLYLIDIDKINSVFLSQINDSQDETECITDNDLTESHILCSNKQNLIKQNNNKENINISFETFWELYDYNKGKKSEVKVKWESMTDEERQSTIDTLPKYKDSTKDKTYRKYPMSFLDMEAWNDEMVTKDISTSNNQYSANTANNNSYSAAYKDFSTVDTSGIPPNSASEVHWSELKSMGMFSNKQNPTAIAPNSKASKDIDEWLSTLVSKNRKVA